MCGWVCKFPVFIAVVWTYGCATLPFGGAPAVPAAPAKVTAAEDDDLSDLVAQLRSDLNREKQFEAQRPQKNPSKQQLAGGSSQDRAFADRAAKLFGQIDGLNLPIRMPVVGVRPADLDDSWHAPRDGGAREHKGIDIFAKKGTEVVAVADGVLSFIGDQRLGGHCIWLTTENGASFYYAHLDRWAPGLYEGMEVQSGDLLGYVGNTGNAAHTPSHLHFGINRNDEMINPFPILLKASWTPAAHAHVELHGGLGTR